MKGGGKVSPADRLLCKGLTAYAAFVIKQRRLDLGLSMEDLIDLSGCCREVICGKYDFHLVYAYRLCRALLMPLDALTPPGMFPRSKARRRKTAKVYVDPRGFEFVKSS